MKVTDLVRLITESVGKNLCFDLACHTLNHWKLSVGSRAEFNS